MTAFLSVFPVIILVILKQQRPLLSRSRPQTDVILTQTFQKKKEKDEG